MQCSICGSSEFVSKKVLWAALVDEWQLAPFEEEYVNRQQGTCCSVCGANLRSIALANALRSFLGESATLKDVVAARSTQELEILEINEAGTLTPMLRQLGKYTYAAYPDVDMHALPYDAETFDLVIHSDTLEHVEQPIHALKECRRVLKPGGAVCFTVPVIVGRMSRSRKGLGNSYHGNPATSKYDYVVQTEFGADAWTCAMEAGFAEVAIHVLDYPAATAFLARKAN